MQTAPSARAGIGFYSAGEFDLSTFPAEVLEESVELGRACVGKRHRSRGVLFLLWRGVIEYTSFNRMRSCFGCSSLTSQDPNTGMRCYRQLSRAGAVHPEIRVEPLPGFECVEDRATQTGEEVRIPALFDTYLKYGACVLGPPAIDRSFGTIDFLTYALVTEEHKRNFVGEVG
jgi:putative hemolysin